MIRQFLKLFNFKFIMNHFYTLQLLSSSPLQFFKSKFAKIKVTRIFKSSFLIKMTKAYFL